MIRKLAFLFLLISSPAYAAVTAQLATYDGAQFNQDATTTSTSLTFTAPFIQVPGNYSYNGKIFIVPEGLVSIFAIDPSTNYNDGGYRYIWAGDQEKFTRALMFMFQTGNRDDGVSLATAESTIRLRKLGMTCGNTSAVVKDLLSKVGIVSRVVHFLTAGTTNGFDDGHIALEVMVGTQWVFEDFDLKERFKLSGGAYADVDDIIDNGVGTLTPEELATEGFYEDDYNGTKVRYAVYNWQTLGTPALKAAWEARVYQIPAIDYAGGTVLGVAYAAGTYAFMPPGTSGATAYVTGLGYHVVSRAIFDAMFY